MSDFEEIINIIRSMDLTEEQLHKIRAVAQLKEINLDKPRKQTNNLSEEEKAFFCKCSDNRSGKNNKRACPKCKSYNTIEYGNRKGRQRYYCKDCKHTFGDTVGTVFFRSKLPLATWKELIEMVLMGASVREIARDLHINKDTALYNRHRLCSLILQLVDNTDRFPSIAEGDEYYLPLSFKDIKDPRFFVEVLGRMPFTHMSMNKRIEYCEKLGYSREFLEKLYENEELCKQELLQYVEEKDLKTPNKFSLALNTMPKDKIFQVLSTLDTQQKKKRGISNQQECVLSCVDVNGNHFLKPVCVGRIEPKHIEKNLVPHLTKGTILVTDSHRAYKTVANKNKIPLRQIPSGKHTSNGFNLAHINGYHRNISAFMKKYVEVSSKYSDHYLALFSWKEKNKDLETKDKVDVLIDLLTQQAKQIHLRKFACKPMPIDMKGII